MSKIKNIEEGRGCGPFYDFLIFFVAGTKETTVISRCGMISPHWWSLLSYRCISNAFLYITFGDSNLPVLGGLLRYGAPLEQVATNLVEQRIILKKCNNKKTEK